MRQRGQLSTSSTGAESSFGGAIGKTTLTQRHAARPVQLAADAHTGLDDGGVQAAAAHGLSAPGGRLPHLDAIQRSFGDHDVGGVTAHVGEAAREANQELGAHAYATGDHVAFADASPDLFLVAHEAAHVVQQRAGVHLSSAVGQVGDPYEQHADAVAARVVAGESAADLLGAPVGGGGGGGVQRKGKGKPKDGDGDAAAPKKLDLAAVGQADGIKVGVALVHNAADNEKIRGSRTGVSFKAMLTKYKDYKAKEHFKTLTARFAAEQKESGDPEFDRVTTREEGEMFAGFTLGNDMNFKWTGEGWAKSHHGIGGSPPQVDKIVPFSEQSGDDALTNAAALSEAVGRLPGRTDDRNIAQISFFTHGGRGEIKTGASFQGASVVTSGIEKYLLPSVDVNLFACNVAGTKMSVEGDDNHDEKEGAGTFADKMAHQLAEKGHDGRVFGHETKAPATTNSRGREFNFGKDGVTTADNWTMIFDPAFRKESVAAIVQQLSAQQPELVEEAFERASRDWLADVGMHERVTGLPPDESGKAPEAGFAISFAREETIAFVQKLWPGVAAVELASDADFQTVGAGSYVAPPGARKAEEKPAAKTKEKAKGKSKDKAAHAAKTPGTLLDEKHVAKALKYYEAHEEQYPAEVVARIIGRTRVAPPPAETMMERARQIAETAIEVIKVVVGAGIDEELIESVAKFQRAEGLGVDGIAGGGTLTAMFGEDIRPKAKKGAAATGEKDAKKGHQPEAAASSGDPTIAAAQFDGYDWTALVSYNKKDGSKASETISDEDRAKLKEIAAKRPAVLDSELARLGSRVKKWVPYGGTEGWQYAGNSRAAKVPGGQSDRLLRLAAEELYTGPSLEAYFNAIVTYDGTLSIGAGFADSEAAEYVHRWLAKDPAARAALLGAGFAVSAHREFLAIDNDGSIVTGGAAKKFLRSKENGDILDYLSGLMEQPGSADKAMDAQMSLLEEDFIDEITSGLRSAMMGWPDDAVRAGMHMSYWDPAGGPIKNPNDFSATGGDPIAMVKMFGKNMKKYIRQGNGAYVIGASGNTKFPLEGHLARWGHEYLAGPIESCATVEMTFEEVGSDPALANHVLVLSGKVKPTAPGKHTFFDLGAL